MRMGILIWLIILPLSLYAERDFEREELQQRISPVGQVRVKGLPAAAANEAVAKQDQPKKLPGQETFENYCSACHATGVAGAPKFRTEDWAPRLAKKNIDQLASSAMNGLNVMPPKGTCAECSEADIKAAIQYMVPQHD